MSGDRLRNLCDLHMHLGSATPAHTLWEIAHEQGIALKEKNYWQFLKAIEEVRTESFDDYIARFKYTEKIQSSPLAVERCVQEAFSHAYRKANVSLLELRFNPLYRNGEGLYDLDKIIFSAIIGMKKAMMIYPIRGGLILCMDRRLSPELNLIIAEKAAKFSQEGIVGIDVAGTIAQGFSWDDVLPGIEIARKQGLGVTIHAGEVTSSEEVWEVVEKIKPDRIGHGVKACKDVALLRELYHRNIHLEICPTSNLCTIGSVENIAEMGEIFKKLKSFKVSFSINSDNPSFLGTDVLKEVSMLLDNNLMTVEEIDDCMENARKASFVRRQVNFAFLPE